jgi:hypothetical protein
MPTKRVVKTKKALKRLDRVEALLSKVIDQYASDDSKVRELLTSARDSVVRAKVEAKAPAKAKPRARTEPSAKAKSPKSAGSPKRTRLQADKSKKRHLTSQGRKPRKRVLKPPASVQSNALTVGVAAPGASISAEPGV